MKNKIFHTQDLCLRTNLVCAKNGAGMESNMAQEEVFYFLSTDGKTKVHAVRWIPEDGSYHAVLQITHGMIEFIERYRPFAEFLTGQGYMVVGHDHIGHGESVASTEDWGYFAKDHPSDVLIEDMHTLRVMTQKDHPGVPYFMMGHSMGSYMLRKYLTRYGEGLSGAIIMGTGSVPDKLTKLGMRVARFLSFFFGWKHRSKLLTKLSFGAPYKKYDLTGKTTDNSWLTKDEEIVESYYREPKCTFSFTLNGYMGLYEAVYYDNQMENIEKIPKTLPLFLVSGADDPVGDCGEGVKRVYHQFTEAKIEDVTWKLYPDDRHEILNETDRDQVYRDILAWMNVHQS